VDSSSDRTSSSVFSRCRMRPISGITRNAEGILKVNVWEKEAADHELSRCMGRVCMIAAGRVKYLAGIKIARDEALRSHCSKKEC